MQEVLLFQVLGLWYQNLKESLQIGLWQHVGFLIQEYHKMDFQKVEFLVVVSWGSNLLVEEIVVEYFLVVEFLVEVSVDVEFMVIAECLDFHGVVHLDFLVRERKNLDQCQTELWQVWVDDVLGLDFE